MNLQTRLTRRILVVPITMLLASTSTFAQVENESFKIATIDADAAELSYSLAIGDGIIVAGAPADRTLNSQSGAAFLFDLSTGEQLLKVLASDGGRNHRFGTSVAIDNGILAVGSPRGSVSGSNTGQVHLFNANPTSPNFGNEVAILTADDEANNNHFGTSVVFNNGIVIVGAPLADDNAINPGAVYFFDADPLSANFGNQMMKIAADNAASSDRFGHSLAIDTDLLIVGAWNKTAFSGAAYVFDANPLSPEFGNQLTQLVGEGMFGAAEFGRAVAIDDYTAAIGAREDGNGAVYLFDVDPLSPNFGAQLIEINVSLSDAPGRFGNSVAINAGKVASGTQLGNANGFGAGVAYVFDANTGEQIAHYLPSDGDSFGQFGFSLAMSDDGLIVVGAMGGVSSDGFRGGAYVFDGPLFVCTADFTDDGQLNFFDISVFLTLFQFNDPAADFNNDGNWDFFDVSAFLTAFLAGCP